MQKVPDTFDESYRKRVDDNLRYLFLGQKPSIPVSSRSNVDQLPVREKDVRIIWAKNVLKDMQQHKTENFYDYSMRTNIFMISPIVVVERNNLNGVDYRITYKLTGTIHRGVLEKVYLWAITTTNPNPWTCSHRKSPGRYIDSGWDVGLFMICLVNNVKGAIRRLTP